MISGKENKCPNCNSNNYRISESNMLPDYTCNICDWKFNKKKV